MALLINQNINAYGAMPKLTACQLHLFVVRSGNVSLQCLPRLLIQSHVSENSANATVIWAERDDLGLLAPRAQKLLEPEWQTSFCLSSRKFIQCGDGDPGGAKGATRCLITPVNDLQKARNLKQPHIAHTSIQGVPLNLSLLLCALSPIPVDISFSNLVHKVP